jgi:hypothetical protein
VKKQRFSCDGCHIGRLTSLDEIYPILREVLPLPKNITRGMPLVEMKGKTGADGKISVGTAGYLSINTYPEKGELIVIMGGIDVSPKEIQVFLKDHFGAKNVIVTG